MQRIGFAPMSRLAFWALWVPVLAGLTACTRSGDDAAFVLADGDSGLDFVHHNGMHGEFYFVEMMGAGAAWLDYDNDGDLDAYLVQGAPLRPDTGNAASYSDRLYRNDTETADRPKFTDVTAAAGLPTGQYGMGVATGDVNNDGWVDLYVTNFGGNQLLLNKGDGGFEPVDSAAGGSADWSVSASFADYDRDGWLDLYVGNYVDSRLANHKPCRSLSSARDYCSPLVYPPKPDRLFHNRGDGRFDDVSAAAGLRAVYGGALGVVSADLNGDGWTDFYVANDGVPNQLWLNQGGRGFVDEAPVAGVAVNMNGAPEASMGVDAADFDGDGDLDLFMTHLARESNTLYVNDGRGWFRDQTVSLGLANASLSATGFGTRWFDFDNDGDLDLFCANGAVTLLEEQAARGDPHPLRQANQLFARTPDGGYALVAAGAAFGVEDVSRGTAFGDFDNDGDVDLLVTNNNGPARLWINRAGAARSWIGVRATLAANGRDAYGARVTATTASGPRTAQVRTDGSYASASDPRLVFGLGARTAPIDVEVEWPDGTRERWPQLPLGQYHTLVKGEGGA